MKNLTTPRTLAECSFVTGHRLAQIERRASGAITMLVVVVLAVLGALLLVHYLTPCETGVLCSAILPAGCDQQGRYDTRPHGPAEAATEIGADDDHLPGDGSLAWLGMILLLGSALAAILGVLYALS